MIKIKTMTLTAEKVGAEDGLGDGEFTGYAAVWDNIDSYGDITRKGAFSDSLKAYGENGAGVPCYWSHRMDDPDFNIGVTKSAVEDDTGLLVHVALDMDSPKGAYVHRLIQQDRVKQMSFAYEVTDGAPLDDGGVEIKAARLFEVSVVPVGANPLAELTGVKAFAELALAEVKVGARHAKSDADKLHQIRDLVDELLGGSEEDTQDPAVAPAEDDSEAEKKQTALAKLAQLHTRKETV